jgi:hypothetical protein
LPIIAERLADKLRAAKATVSFIGLLGGALLNEKRSDARMVSHT